MQDFFFFFGLLLEKEENNSDSVRGTASQNNKDGRKVRDREHIGDETKDESGGKLNPGKGREAGSARRQSCFDLHIFVNSQISFFSCSAG